MNLLPPASSTLTAYKCALATSLISTYGYWIKGKPSLTSESDIMNDLKNLQDVNSL